MGRARLSAVVLDTCAILWLSSGAPIRAVSAGAIGAARTEDGVLVSPISAWEIAVKHARRPEELGLSEGPEVFFAAFVGQIGVRLVDLGVRVLIRSTELESYPHKDPADRIIIATSLEHGARIVTGDRRILDYLPDALAY